MAWLVKSDASYLGVPFDWVDKDEVEEVHFRHGLDLSLSRSLSAKNVPKTARARRPCKGPPRQNIFFVDYNVVCKPKFKGLVEQVEPDLHLFAPINLEFHDGRPMEGDFYVFNCNVDIDCVITDNEPVWFKDHGDGKVMSTMPGIQILTPMEIVLSRPQIAGRHLWTGGPLGWNQLFISDEFYEICRKAKFRAWEYRRECKEIDCEWRAEEQMGPMLETWRTYVANDRDCEAEST